MIDLLIYLALTALVVYLCWSPVRLIYGDHKEIKRAYTAEAMANWDKHHLHMPAPNIGAYVNEEFEKELFKAKRSLVITIPIYLILMDFVQAYARTHRELVWLRRGGASDVEVWPSLLSVAGWRIGTLVVSIADVFGKALSVFLRHFSFVIQTYLIPVVIFGSIFSFLLFPVPIFAFLQRISGKVASRFRDTEAATSPPPPPPPLSLPAPSYTPQFLHTSSYGAGLEWYSPFPFFEPNDFSRAQQRKVDSIVRSTPESDEEDERLESHTTTGARFTRQPPRKPKAILELEPPHLIEKED